MPIDARTAKWYRRFLQIAKEVSTWSKDTSTQVGCVITSPDFVLKQTGYNGFPRGANDNVPARHERPLKYRWFEHAERNAIYNAARSGDRLSGCILFCRLVPCMDCARAIVQSGIKLVVVEGDDKNEEHRKRWEADHILAKELFSETGVLLVEMGKVEISDG